MFSISRFQQIIKPIMHGRFQKHVRKHQADKHTKGFGCQNLLTAMVYAQLGHCNSLRTLEQAFNSNSSHHYHLNVRSIRRSTVAEALAKRDTQPFADMPGELMAACGKTLRRETTDLLYLPDSTPVSLKGHGFDEWTTSNGRIKGLKIHVLMNHASGCPVAQSITDAAVNDIDEHYLVQPEKGATYVFDKGYCDYNRWAELDEAEACFVTRLKANAAVNVIDSFMPSESILADEHIRFRHRKNGNRANRCYGKTLRRITVERKGKAPLVLLTNNLKADAQEIAATYKERWQIELLFKWLKQHLKLKRFLGRSANAVKLQLLCAMIAYLLLKLYHRSIQATDSLHLLAARISNGLFERPQTLYAYYARRKKKIRELARAQGSLW